MVDRAPELHPAAEELLAGIDLPPRPALSVGAARESLNEVLVQAEPTVAVDSVRDYRIPVGGGDDEITVRAYRPDAEGTLPVLVYFHGGGWVRGNVDTHDELCRSLATEVGAVVLSVDYRRAPEHPFPTPLDDAYAATEWAVEYADVVGGDPDRVAVGGDSAGGNLAAAVALRARDEDGPPLVHQLLLYPITDHAFDTDSYRENAEGYLLTRRGMQWYWNHYLDREIDGRHPYASPLRARDLGDLPPATVVTAGYDPLRDEGAAYADRLREAGVAVTHDHYPDTIHAFLSFDALAGAGGDEATATVAGELRAAFDAD